MALPRLFMNLDTASEIPFGLRDEPSVRVLHAALQLKPWQRAIQAPHALCPYPKGSTKAAEWQPDLEAQERYRQLAQAAA
jgi:hypothetical protein